MPRVSKTLWRTSDGDMLDEIAAEVYGVDNRGLALVLDANPHALDRPVLPAGIAIALPDAEDIAPAEPTKVLRIFS